MEIKVKCPKCGHIITVEGYNESTQCPECHTALKINLDDIQKQRKNMQKLTVLLNIPAFIIAFLAYGQGVKIGYLTAGILLYQVIWVTVQRAMTMKKLTSHKNK